ncbi:MAG: bifunctional aconitate hydratase 2/2-methylisocitrate dehydratase [Deltaproteobacteria bacterium]|jgi:aconitate hydratase 2/2-methylisocitrate dehydratase|uniref:bifunctional aconitate hydratase 2/2-methylisocitrate dehydratase n=1 Tax=Hydrosulfovibrio ferrireducens TaxID=2934181 RepID=UPI00122AA018|nr:MAG: bifunctional aconitate hydratase 2/2-methylisocitrate dehydratase [Deltaproteobacteria bacterium]
MLEAYQKHVAERAALGLPPLPLSADQTTALVALLQKPAVGTEATLVDLISNQVPPGVDEASKVKAEFLAGVAQGRIVSPLIDRKAAVKLLGTMLGGYNVQPLIDLLDDAALAPDAVAALSSTLLVYDSFNEVAAKAKSNDHAKQVLTNWAEATWFTSRAPMPEELTVTVFKVAGETNTDDLSPASEAWSRPDIPLHAQSMLINRLPGSLPVIEELKKKEHPIAYVGDVVGTGSSRKSGVNSMLWHMGRDIPHVPAKRTGGVVMGSTIAPIYFNTAEDSGMLPIQCDVTSLETGDIITINTRTGTISREGQVVTTFSLSPATLPDEVQAGGRVNLIIGRGLTAKAREALRLPPSTLFREPEVPKDSGKGYTLAQKMVGKACNLPGVRPGMYCEPRMTSVGSQDTTGPMTRDEIKELACLKFSAPLVMQSFCHTAAYPKPVDVKTHQTLPGFISERGGISLRPGDGVVHSWLNRMVLPDTVGTGGDSHTRFPIGISFPAGSGLVAFAAATGSMPLVMPESVLIRFTGTMQPGITLRDLVNAIPWVAIQKELLTVEKKGKKNLFAGTVLEIEGLPDLAVEQAFELADASAERSAAACTVRLNKEPVAEFLRSNVELLKSLLTRGYQDADAIRNRIAAMEAWLAAPELLAPDADAEYKAVLDIDLNTITEPVLACPNDPDDVKLLSQVAGTAIDEVFVGSCMTNIGHFRALAKILDNRPQVGVRLWVAPPTRMDEEQLKSEGLYSILGRAGARTEIPGCSLCMGNQARTRDNAVVFSTSTRNFDNRIGTSTKVFLGSAELAAVCAVLGRIPTVAEYHAILAERVTPKADEVYRYLNFHRIEGYAEKGW